MEILGKMYRHRSLLGLTIFGCLALSIPAFADGLHSVVYSDGPINGTSGASFIGSLGAETGAVTDSFTLATGSILREVTDIGLWAFGTPASVQWGIRSLLDTPPNCFIDTDCRLATSTLMNNFLFVNTSGYSVWSSSFSLPNIPLPPGTYYLTLEGGSSLEDGSTRDLLFWDQNSGPSAAFLGGGLFGVPIPAESFEITGTTGIPEPLTYGLFCALLLGVFGAAGVRRRKQA
jgi:hypothetical protein